jgi:hypothetical protein
MITTLRKVAVALALLALSGCAGWTRVAAAKPQKLGALTLHPQNDWSSAKWGAVRTWTVHGPQLEAITIVSGLADGKPLERPANYKEKMPLFRSGMTGSEVAELTVESLQRMGYGRVELTGMAPETFGGQPGFRFELDLTDAAGLDGSGIGAGAISKGKLYLLVYRSPKEHYFARYKPAVDHLIASAQLKE